MPQRPLDVFDRDGRWRVPSSIPIGGRRPVLDHGERVCRQSRNRVDVAFSAPSTDSVRATLEEAVGILTQGQ